MQSRYYPSYNLNLGIQGISLIYSFVFFLTANRHKWTYIKNTCFMPKLVVRIYFFIGVYLRSFVVKKRKAGEFLIPAFFY